MKLRPWRTFYIVGLATLAFTTRGYDTAILLASLLDLEVEESRNDKGRTVKPRSPLPRLGKRVQGGDKGENESLPTRYLDA